MNLLQFTLKTSPSVLYVAGVYMVGPVSLVIDGEWMAALCTFLAGVCIVLGMFLGAALHRHKLVHSRLSGYIISVVHNSEEGLPSEAVAAAYCDHVNENPLG